MGKKKKKRKKTWPGLGRRSDPPTGSRAERSEVAQGLLRLLEPDLPELPLELTLDLRPKAPAPMGRGRRSRFQHEQAKEWLILRGRFVDGTAFQLSIWERTRTKVLPGRIKHKKGETYQKPTKRKGKQVTRMTLRLRFKAKRYPALDEELLSWAVQLPGFAEPQEITLTAKGDKSELRFSSEADGNHYPEDLVRWAALMFLSCYQALGSAAPPPKRPKRPKPAAAPKLQAPQLTAPAAPRPTGDPERLFQNLVLATLADGRIDAAEQAFLADRARRLGLDTARARALAKEVTSGQRRGYYRPSDPATRELAFAEIARVFHVDGEVTRRERALLLKLGEALEVPAATLQAALPAEPGYEVDPEG